MIAINIQEAKTHLSRYARRVKAGETILLCDRNRPFAEIRPLPPERAKVRLGLFRDAFQVPDDFNDPMGEFERDFYSAPSPS